jgi:hypothetical protein
MFYFYFWFFLYLQKKFLSSDDAYSVIDDMNMAMRFSKMFSKSLPGTIEYTKPYWQRAHVTPTPHDISLTTWVTDKNYDQLIRIAQMWNGEWERKRV